MTNRPSTMLLHLTPHLLARIEALGFVPGSEGALPWLVALAEEQRAILSAPVKGVDIEEVLRLEATPGPWLHYKRPNTEPREWPAWALADVEDEEEQRITAEGEPNDIALIATYRTVAPALAREVVALRAELDDENRALPTFCRLVERTAAALGLVGERFDPELGAMCLPSWHDLPERVEHLIRERDEARAALSDGLKTTAEVLGALQIRNESLERQLNDMRRAWNDADLMRASMP